MSDIDYGNPESSVAITTLWTDRRRLIPKLDKAYNIIGNLYSSHGINYLIQTLRKHPYIRTLVLFGHCMTKSDEDLLRLWHEGIRDGKIPGTKVSVLLPPEDVELVRAHVRIVDCRGKSLEQLNQLLVELRETRVPYAEPREVPLHAEENLETLPSPLSGHYLYEESVFAAWVKVLNYTLKFGDRKMTEYGEGQKEYNNIMVTIGKHIDVVEMGFRDRFSEAELAQYYAEHILHGAKPEELGISYTYGDRLFNFHGTDQIAYIIDKLGKFPFTRRAVAVLWQPERDREDEHGPCLNFLSCNIHGDAIYMSVLFRSNDLYNAWYKNVLALMKLQQHITAQINAKFGTSYVPGKFTVTCVSAHIYEHNFKDARETVEQNLQHLTNLIVDPKGLFLVRINGGIEVEYRSNAGERLALFKGSDGEALYKSIARDDVFSFFAHSAYLGYEIAKAEQCLRTGVPYVQDRGISAPETL